MLHRGVCPDAGVVVGPLPVCIEVVDEPLIIAHDLAIDGLVHFAAPEVLLDRVVRYFARRILKLDDSAIQAKSKTGKLINGLQTLRVASASSLVGIQMTCSLRLARQVVTLQIALQAII
jgi:hypothetical protein